MLMFHVPWIFIHFQEQSGQKRFYIRSEKRHISWEHFWKKGMKLDKIKNSFFENCVRSKTKYNYEKYYRGLYTLNEILFDIISRLILENSNTFFKQILMKNGKTHQQTYHIKTYQLESYWTFKNFIIKVIRRISFSPHPILNSKMAFLCSVVQFC